MTARRSGYRSQRRPRTPVTSTRVLVEAGWAQKAASAAVSSMPEPKDCPRCDGAGAGCGACGGRGWIPEAEWAAALQLAFIAACGLVLPCEGLEGGEAA